MSAAFFDGSDLSKALKGEPNESQATANTYGIKVRAARAEVASRVLNSLRSIRDNNPSEWDKITYSDGQTICNLWDYLSELERESKKDLRD